MLVLPRSMASSVITSYSIHYTKLYDAFAARAQNHEHFDPDDEPAEGKRKWETDLTPDDEDEGHIGGGIAYDDGRLFVTTGFAA